MSDNLKIFGINYPDTSGFKAKDTEGNTLTFTTGSGGSSATLGTKNITANGTYTATNDNYDGYSEVSVNVPTGTARTSADLTTDGATVNVPAGLYAAAASKTIASGSAQTPTTTITANPSISVNSSGLITASVSGSQSITPTVSAGYISVGTAGTVSVSGSTTSQLSIQAATTITPSTTSQTAVAAGKYTTGAVTVAAMPVGAEGTPTAAKGTVSNYSVLVTPSVTNTAGYISGGTKTGTAVTVSASELVSGSETKTANGTYDVTNLASLVVNIPIVTYRTGSSAPSNSLGSDGDIYLQTS